MPHANDPIPPADAADTGVSHRGRRIHLDVRIDSPGREGLAGVTPSSIYKPFPQQEQLSLPPDGRSPDDQPAWRKDFPIDWPQDHYVARRDFTKFLVLTSFAFVVGQVWIGIQNLWRKRRGEPPVQKIATLSQLAGGAVLSFNYPTDHDPCVLIRLPSGDLVAYSQKCTHLSCAVIPQPDKGLIYCPCHEGLFDLATGSVLAGPPPRPLPRILLKVRDQDVYATGIDLRTV